MKSHPFLDSLVRMRTPLDLAQLREAMKELGNPQKKYKCVQVTGTNGKGSTACMIANGLKKCGLFTSPHLHELNERIVIDEKQITDAELNEFVERVKPLAEKHGLSFFETITAVALLYFAEKKCGYAVLEVGLGGRLDATSVCFPAVSVVTPIGLDHTHILGDTIEKIAGEKAGIIKGNVVVTCRQPAAAMKVIEEKCGLACASLIKAKRRPFSLALKGGFQQDNAACAFEALRLLGAGEAAAKKAVETASWPGRFEQKGNVLFDCAHNEPAMKALAGELQGREFTLVIAMKQDKAHEKVISLIAPLAKKVIVTQYTDGPQPLPASELYKIVQRYNSNSIVVEHPKQALKKARGFTVVAGSLFLVGELRLLAG